MYNSDEKLQIVSYWWRIKQNTTDKCWKTSKPA